MRSIHRPAVRAPRPWFFLLALVAGAAALGLAAGCNRLAGPSAKGAPGEGSPASTTPEVTVIRPERKTVRRPIKRPGYNIEAYQSTRLFAKISGYVDKWHFDIGDEVRKGEVLAELLVPEMDVEVQQKEAVIVQARAEIGQARAAVLTARAHLARTRGQYERLSRVGEGGLLAGENVEEARLGYETSKAALEKAKADVGVAEARLPVAQKARDYAQTLLRYTKIPAPFNGVVTKRHINEGDYVQPEGRKGEALFVVDQVDPVRVFVNVPEAEAVWVRKQDEATVRSQVFPGQPFKGTVTRTARSLDPTTRTLRTEVDLPNPEGKLLPGMYVDVTITPERRNVWALPESAVVVTEEGSYCYRLENGKAVRTPLRIGLRGGDLVQVLKKHVKPTQGSAEEAWEDLTGEEQIIKSGVSELKDGQEVRAASDRK
jgi:RND family efflux transporter MFP subunit